MRNVNLYFLLHWQRVKCYSEEKFQGMYIEVNSGIDYWQINIPQDYRMKTDRYVVKKWISFSFGTILCFIIIGFYRNAECFWKL